MKCPFCHQDLETGNYYVHCHNPHCDITVDMEGTEEMWEALIRAYKALDDAKKCLMKIGYLNMSDHGLGSETMMTDWCKTVALHALKEIETTLEQKDVK